jgi:hypothetical protein
MAGAEFHLVAVVVRAVRVVAGGVVHSGDLAVGVASSGGGAVRGGVTFGVPGGEVPVGGGVPFRVTAGVGPFVGGVPFGVAAGVRPVMRGVAFRVAVSYDATVGVVPFRVAPAVDDVPAAVPFYPVTVGLVVPNVTTGVLAGSVAARVPFSRTVTSDMTVSVYPAAPRLPAVMVPGGVSSGGSAAATAVRHVMPR